MAKNETNFLQVSFAFLLGGIVGATIALLYAPAPGEQTRKRIRQASDEMQNNVRQSYGRIKDKAEIEFSRMKDRASGSVNQAKEYYEQKKSKVREAYQEGKRAFEDQQQAKAEGLPPGTDSGKE